MTLAFRAATAADVPAIVALLVDDGLGAARELDMLAPYVAAFDAMQKDTMNTVYVGEIEGQVVATYQLTFIRGLSLRAAVRAQIESVRVASGLRGQGVGERMMQDAEDRARAAGCSLIQLTTNAKRARARDFYERLGFTASHIGFKRDLT